MNMIMMDHLIRGIQQIGYHIIVTAVCSVDEIVWNSGYVQSSSSIHVVYVGKPFTSDTRYKVTIKYYSALHESEWSTAYFRTALFCT